MGTFSDHISKGKSNLFFLSQLNSNIGLNWDWQVTVSFYTALHLISAHVVSKTGKNYTSHMSINDAINPEIQLSVSKLDQKTYLAYTKLYQLSRRARYLVHDDPKQNKGNDIINSAITVDKHFRRAVQHLDVVMKFMTDTYSITFESTNLKCVELNSLTFDNFKITIS